MAGKRYSRDEINQILSLIDEGLSNREIASKLGRPEAGIRNLLYRKGLIKKAEDETKALLQQRDELRGAVKTLKEQQQALTRDKNP